MANVLLDTTAPYVLVAALGALGWIVNTSVTDLKTANIIEYDITSEDSGTDHFKNFDIYNRSLTHDLSSGWFSFRCLGKSPNACFTNSDNGTPITVRPLAGVSSRSDPQKADPIFRADARLAPQSAIRYRIGVNSADAKVLVLYEPDEKVDTKGAGLIFRQGESLEGWLIANYLRYLILAFGVLSGVLVLWFIVSLIALVVQLCSKSGAAAATEKAETINLIIRQEVKKDE